MSASRRVFLLGIDGASWNVLGPHVQAGRMANLRAFLDRGVHADLKSVCPPVSPAAWSSFHTGRNPIKHGVFGFHSYDSRAAELCFNTSAHIRGRTFWQILSSAGCRVGVVNVPMTFPPPRINGVVVSGFETPSLAAEFCHPPGLRHRVLSAIPEYLLGPDQVAPDRPECLPELIDAGIKEFEQRAALVELLHAADQFDVFMVNLQSLDWLLHRLYVYAVQEIDSHARRHLVSGICRLMEALDESVGRALVVARDYDVQLLVSDHGFTREVGIVYPNSALDEWGYFVRRSSAASHEPVGSLRRAYRRMLYSDWRALRSIAAAADAWRKPPMARRISERRAETAAMLDFDVEETRAAVVASDVYGLLYLNRHPSGPFADTFSAKLEVERDGLARRLRSLMNPVTGKTLFDEVLILERDQASPNGACLPDLILVPPPGCKVLSGRSSNERWAPLLYFAGFADTRGTHAVRGIFAAAGRGVRAAGRVDPLELVDIGPTVLALVGLPVPTDMDGEVVAAIQSERVAVESIAQNAYTEDVAPPVAMTQEEERIVKDRLRMLGYLE